MSNTESDFMPVDPEMERIWREDDDPSFTEVRSAIQEEETEEVESEQPTEEVMDSVDSTVEDDSEAEVSEEADESQSNEETEEVTVPNADEHVIKVDGVEMKLTTDEIRVLASKGIDYTKKTQALAPWRKQISAIQEANLGADDINLMIDVLKGDKNAIAEVLKRTKVDPLELDSESEVAYVPNQYGKDETTLAIEEVVSEIARDPEYDITAKVVDEVWDSASRKQMASNPALIRGLHEEIKMGRYEVVSPIATKMKTMDMVRGNQVRSDLEYYQMAVDNYIQASQQNLTVDKAVSKQQEIQEKASARKAAATTKRMSGGKTVIDYLDDNDEQFNDWYKNIISKS